MFEKHLGKHTSFLRMFSGAVAVQAMLSASSFIVGLLLVRRTSDTQYGYYVLIIATVMLATTLQGSFIGPAMVIRMTRSEQAERANLIGGLMRDQRRLLPFLLFLPVILGVVLQYLTPVTVIVLVLHIGVQVCRILYEEDLLRRNCPEYSSYEASRWRLIPYVW